MNAIMEKVEGYWNELPEAWVETVSLQNDFSPETLRVALGRLETAQNIFGRWIS